MRRPYLRKDITPTVGRYNYPITAFSGVDAETKEGLPLNYASYAYNITVRNGVLANGMGVELPNFGSQTFPDIEVESVPVVNLFFYKHYDYENGVKDDRVIALLADRCVAQGKLNDQYFKYIPYMIFNSLNVTFLNYYHDGADYLIAISDAGEMKLYDGESVTNVLDCPNLSNACVHNGRIFGVVSKSSRVYFSALLDPANWKTGLDQGGYIALTDEGGLVKKIVSFKDSLYVFREYAIHKLSAFGEQTDYNMTKLYISNNQIFADTVAVCNDRIIFLADDGFYSFDGYTCTKILRGIFPLLEDNRYACGSYFNHKYYLASRIKTDEYKMADEVFPFPMKNNAIISYNLDLGEIDIFRGGDVRGFMPVSLSNINRLFIYFNNYIRNMMIGQISETGKFFTHTLRKRWVSANTDFDKLSKDKVLKKIYITNSAPVNLTTRLDEEKTYALPKGYASQMVPVNARADKIGLEIMTEEDTFTVSGVLLEFDLIRRNAQ